MISFLIALGQYGFLKSALMAGILASFGCGIIGTYVVVRRLTFLAGGIAHSVLAGMGAASYFGIEPMLGALMAAVLSALLIGYIHLYWKTQEDTIIGAIWAIGMSIGIIFISYTPGYQTDLIGYLFGNILLVSDTSLWFMLILDSIILMLVIIWNKQFLIICFDPELARVRGIPVKFFYLSLLVLIAISIVLLIQVVGLILVLALLTIPSAISSHYFHSIKAIMILATGIGVLLNIIGLALSYTLNLPAGATIIIVAGILYILSSLLKLYLRQLQSNKK